MANKSEQPGGNPPLSFQDQMRKAAENLKISVKPTVTEKVALTEETEVKKPITTSKEQPVSLGSASSKENMENKEWYIRWSRERNVYAPYMGRVSGYLSKDGKLSEDFLSAERFTDEEDAKSMINNFELEYPREDFKLAEIVDTCLLNYEKALEKLAIARERLATAHSELERLTSAPKPHHGLIGYAKEELTLARRDVRDQISSANFQLKRRQEDGFVPDLKLEVTSEDETIEGHVSSENVGWQGAEDDWHMS